MKLKPKMLFAKILFYIFIIYFGVSLIVYFYQRKLLYHPGENNYLDEIEVPHLNNYFLQDGIIIFFDKNKLLEKLQSK